MFFNSSDSELESPANHHAMYSTSVPISVPAWKTSRKLREELEEEEEVKVFVQFNFEKKWKILIRLVLGIDAKVVQWRMSRIDFNAGSVKLSEDH